MTTVRKAEDFVLILLFGIGLVVTMGLISALAAFPFMLAAGVLHGFWPEIPAFSFLQSLVLVWAWGVVWNRVKFTENGS
jgi:hypothetical protein